MSQVCEVRILQPSIGQKIHPEVDGCDTRTALLRDSVDLGTGTAMTTPRVVQDQ